MLTKPQRIEKMLSSAGISGQEVTVVSPARRRSNSPRAPISSILRRRLRMEFGLSCTACFSETLASMDSLGVSDIRHRVAEFAAALRENAHEMESVRGRTDGRRLIDWAKKNGGENAYQNLILDACNMHLGLSEAKIQESLKLIEANVSPEPGWNTDPCVIEAHRRLFQEAIGANYPVDNVGEGRGIVTLGGGHKYFTCAYILVRLLRGIGCDLPVEWVYLDDNEMTPQMKEIAREIPGVTLVDLSSRVNPRRIGGWEAKVWSITTSRFAEVMFLDADQLPVKDPTYLFEDSEYKSKGSVLWADLPNHLGLDITADAFGSVGLPIPGNSRMPGHGKPSDYRPVESGQLLINKRKCWKALKVCEFLNDHSDFFYPTPRSGQAWHIYGDKSTFYLAWESTGTPYAKPEYPEWLGVQGNGAFGQPDMSGDLIFQHRCQPPEKYSIYKPHDHAPGLLHLDRVDRYLRDLKRRVGDSFRTPIVDPAISGARWYAENNGNAPLDKILAEILLTKGLLRGGLGVECGARDGVSLSVTKALSDHFGWKCILLDADPKHSKGMPSNRPHDTCLRAALTPISGVTKSQVNDVPGWSTVGDGPGEDVIGISWSDLADVFFFGRRPDLLVLDVEGGELPILESIRTMKPRVFCVEHLFVGLDEVIKRLPGYKVEWSDACNVILSEQ